MESKDYQFRKKDYQFRKVKKDEWSVLWKILQDGIELRRQQGSAQWQDGYPNEEIVKNDIEKGQAYVLIKDDVVVATVALIIKDEPTCETINGAWLNTEEFLVVHRIAVSKEFKGMGISQLIFNELETFAHQHQLKSIRMDTNHDNEALLYLLAKNKYAYCGEIIVRGNPRKAFEKVL